MPAQRRHHTTLAALLAALLAGLLLVAGLALAAPADASTAADEQQFVQLINQTRANAGLPPLQVHSELTQQARSWASSMASSDLLAHSSNISRGISAPWVVLGENVGVHSVRDIGQLHAAFVASPSHYANIVDARYTFVGVGVVVTDEGKIWTTHRFMATAAPAPTSAPPTTVPPSTAPPTTAPPSTSPATTSAPPKVPLSTTPTTMAPSTTPPAASPGSTTAPTAPTAPTPPTPTGGEAVAATPSDPGPDEQAPAATADGEGIEPVAAPGPGRPDLATVEQMLIDLIEAGF